MDTREQVVKKSHSVRRYFSLKTREIKTRKSYSIKAFFYLLPALLVLGTFQIYPIIKALGMSFYTEYSYINNEVYARGFDNFEYILSDPDFYLSLKNTFIFVIGVVPLNLVVSVGFALLLNRVGFWKKFFCGVYFLPFITSTVAVAMVWRWMFNSQYGLVNHFLSYFGMLPIAWLSTPSLTIPILILFSVWKGMGYRIIIFVAGLQSIDETYYKAARIDGATAFQRFWHITLPLLTPTLIFVIITSFIGAFKIFDEVYVLYNGTSGPLKSGLTMVYYIFMKFYQNWEFTNAAAASFVLFAIVLVFTLIQLKITKNWNIQ
ncbi:carbohydrate ABC transporter permease [Clostridium formicaceticum]|uniref:Lactose transport system permease protein LacF n=1 Tax=Clostridium formicaceticum TaxID=1497 RepID=A0AAC9RJ64_9CLOT|nr:sugar ABC transporter permease [Clostridium formicaceticum]ARE88086.1 Lactose transport system permease protein LacF [Clostridium formicaceticum]